MPERDRDRHGSIVAFAVFVCLLIVAMIGWYEGFKSGQESHQSTSAEAYTDQAEAKIQETCVTLSGASQAECIAEAVGSAREKQRAEEDLDAQQEVAEWSRWLLHFTVIMAGVTTLGVVFVWQTLEATRQMARETTRIGEAQVRAYLIVKSVKLKVKKDGELQNRLSVHVVNSGTTPAHDVMVSTAQKNSETGVITQDIPAGEPATCAIDYRIDAPQSGPFHTQKLHIKVTWKDVFGRRQVKRFRYWFFVSFPIKAGEYSLARDHDQMLEPDARDEQNGA